MVDKNKGLSLGRNIKIGFFHLGSGMADVLTTGVWNRIMITDLGISATIVSLLAALRYFLVPIGIWAGRFSDRVRVLGTRRLFWIWLGRALMVLSTFGLGFGTAEFMNNLESIPIHAWLIVVVSMILFSLGNALSGSTFLALIYDRASEAQRGRAVGIVWTFLLVGFTVGGILFAILLPGEEGAEGIAFTAGDVIRMFAIAGGIFVLLWFVSLLGEERRSTGDADADTAQHSEAESTSLKADLGLVWRNPVMRAFLFYLTLSMMFAFSQDAVLEPFAGDVFDMSASQTNRFAAYWGGASIVMSLISLRLLKYQWFTHTRLAQIGVVILFLTFVLLSASSIFGVQAIVMPGLLLLGAGLGFWNIGTLGLMMDMSPVGRAGTFLGFWTMVVTIARGIGVTTGGIVRDLGLAFTGDLQIAYAIVFGVPAVGIIVALLYLNHIHVEKFKDEMQAPADTTAILAGSMD